MNSKALKFLFIDLLLVLHVYAQNQYELTTNWRCQPVSKVSGTGENISTLAYATSNWLPATVPGTVLTTLLNNHLIADPFYGMNNKYIADIYETGRDYYTYWFVNDFTEKAPVKNELVWLHLRGVNYSCEIYLNGHKVNAQTHTGMYLRQTYNITPLLAKGGRNRLAILVLPPDPVGNPNGGQGGDGEIARNVAHQYVAGWDWIQPIRDRNTGIWDKVTIEKTRSINLKNPHIVTLVPGKRFPGVAQQPALIKASAEIENPGAQPVQGRLQLTIDGKTVSQTVTIAAHSSREVQLPIHQLMNPKLWWPNGYGKQPLYKATYQFVQGSQLLDSETVSIGVRELQTQWNERSQSREIWVNGQKIFIKGGNYIVSDAMLRLSAKRYDAEMRFHRDMNLNLVRIWGGALTERPEFYAACDKFGLLVFQDFWFSGDCNGKWTDPMKKEDQLTRRTYPDDHALAIASFADQVKMICNHASLAIYCGGNEIAPPQDILLAMKDSVLPALDSTRYFFDYSNSSDMSYNFLGGNGDGPYGIQNISTFWQDRTYPFNSEVGSVGVGDYESLQRFIPEKNLQAPVYHAENNKKNEVDSVWEYHKYIGYDATIEAYGKPQSAKDFATKAQLVNYDQYRALAEGFSAHMWDWYTGFIIWKTQNPWTALRGQMYDYYLDPNACLYGLHNGSEPVHVMYNPTDGMIMIVNNTFTTQHNLFLQVKAYDMQGKERTLTKVFVEAGASLAQKYLSLKNSIDKLRAKNGLFLSLQVTGPNNKLVSENLYWLPEFYRPIYWLANAAAHANYSSKANCK